MKKLLLIILFILVFVTSVFAQTGLWKYPSNYNDPDNQWLNEELIGDGYLDTAGTVMVTENKTWSSFIELIRNVSNCGAVRFYAHWEGLTGINLIDIDLYYNGVWNNLYEGVFDDQIWEEKSIGTVEFVTKARVRFYAKKADTVYLYAFQFYDPVYYVTLGASRIADATRVDQSHNDNASIKPWEIGTTVYNSKFKLISEQETVPNGVVFKPDGLIMYVIGESGDAVWQYTLSTAWDVSTATYADKTKSVADKSTSPQGIFLSPDGLKMYFISITTPETVFQYTLSVAWDISTATYADKSVDISGNSTDPTDLFFSSDGTKMYMVSSYPTNEVFQYTLTTAWDVSTASDSGKSIVVNSEDITPKGLFFRSDGLRMYMVGSGSGSVYQYTLTTAWDVSTASYANKSVDVSSEDILPYGVAFNSDGTKMYMVGNTNDTIYQYSLASAWNKTNDFILATRIYGSKGPYVRAYKLRWRISGGTFADVGSTGAITYSAVTDLTDGGDLLIEEKLCDAQSAYTWQNGLESEGDNLLPDSGTYSLADEYYTEFQWALSCDDANDEYEYEFELWDVTEPFSIGTCLASLTIAITTIGWSHTWSNHVISKWNTKEFSKWNGLE